MAINGFSLDHRVSELPLSGTSSAAAVNALDDRLSLFELLSWHSTDAIGPEVGVSDLNASQTTQVFVS